MKLDKDKMAINENEKEVVGKEYGKDGDSL